MKLQDILKLAVQMGIEKDPRGKAEIKRLLASNKEKYEKLSEEEKEYFDTSSLENPFPDSRILVGDPKIEVKSVMVGIDMEVPEVLLADRLREKGEAIDLIISHHPEGVALVNLDKVDEDKKGRYETLFKHIQDQLQGTIKEVRPSTRLTDSVACLSGNTYDMSGYMEKILKSAGQKTPENKRVLELNMAHPVMEKIHAMFEKDKNDAQLNNYIHLLLDLAVIGEGGKVDDPSRFSKLVGNLMAAV